MFGKETGGEEGREEGREGRGGRVFSVWKVRTHLKMSGLERTFPGFLERWALHFHPRS